MTSRLTLPTTVLVIVVWAGLAAAGMRDSGSVLLLAVAPTALVVIGLRARSVVRRRTTALLGLGLGLWAAIAWAWMRPLRAAVTVDGVPCGSALLPGPRATIDDASGCFFLVRDQFESAALVAVVALVVSVVTCCSVVADSRAASSVPGGEVVPTRHPDSVNQGRLGGPTAGGSADSAGQRG